MCSDENAKFKTHVRQAGMDTVLIKPPSHRCALLAEWQQKILGKRRLTQGKPGDYGIKQGWKPEYALKNNVFQ